MKSIKTSLLVGAVIAAAFALSVVPSEAAKKKAAKCAASPGICSTNCKGGSCELRNCDASGAVSTPMFSSKVCKQPDCPSKC